MRLGGFTGVWGCGPTLDKKRRMLEAEGVEIDDAGRIATTCLHCFGEDAGGGDKDEAALGGAILQMCKARGAEKTC